MTDTLSACLAYIDPGSGSLLMQFLIAGFIGAGAFFRNQIGELLSWIRRKTFAHRS